MNYYPLLNLLHLNKPFKIHLNFDQPRIHNLTIAISEWG